MLNQNLVILAAFGYLLFLFAIAYYGDWRRAQGKSIIANPYIYTLSLAVYCTSWTFFGSVGRAATQGLPFLTVYLGPTVLAFVWWFVLRKMLRICKDNHLTTMSDFLTLRYGKRPLVGLLATLGVLLAIVPYIGLQLKSISDTFNILVQQAVVSPLHVPVFHDTAFYVALILAVFCILFGARHLDPTERHEGMVAAVAFESLIKLVAFLAIGFLVTYGLFHGWKEIFSRIRQQEGCLGLMQLNTGPHNSYLLMLVQTLLGMGAIMFLPRQFHMAVVENTDERHILTAMWLLPLYLLVINLFVMPIAFGGLLLGLPAAQGDTFVLQIPLQNGHPGLALLTFLGGLSASTAMVAVASVAVSTMLLNSLVMPLALRLKLEKHLPPVLLQLKRAAIIAGDSPGIRQLSGNRPFDHAGGYGDDRLLRRHAAGSRHPGGPVLAGCHPGRGYCRAGPGVPHLGLHPHLSVLDQRRLVSGKHPGERALGSDLAEAHGSSGLGRSGRSLPCLFLVHVFQCGGLCRRFPVDQCQSGGS